MQLGDVTDRVRDALRGESANDDDADNQSEDRGDGVRGRLPAVTRRRVLAGVLGVAGARAADNVLVGYGILTGTNLLEQDVGALATERLRPSPFETTVGGSSLSLGAGVLTVDDDSYDLADLSPAAGREVDRAHDLTADARGVERGPFEELAADWNAIASDAPDTAAADADATDSADAGEPANVVVRPMARPEFFAALADADPRPFTVQALRGSEYDPASVDTVEAFARVDARRPAALVDGLMQGFNERTSYDAPRYVAGSVEDNVLMGAGDLRAGFEDPVTFDALLNQRDSGMFCYEFVHRSIDAFHAVRPHRQRAPVFAGVVTDDRHKHAYTALASAYRDDGDLVVPVTFVDYTHSTLYDDVAADVVLGDGVDAYNSRHRATAVFWNGYAVV